MNNSGRVSWDAGMNQSEQMMYEYDTGGSNSTLQVSTNSTGETTGLDSNMENVKFWIEGILLPLIAVFGIGG